MTDERLALLFELADELYAEKQAESGRIDPIGIAWASDESRGKLFVYSAFGVRSRDLINTLNLPSMQDLKFTEHQDLNERRAQTLLP